MSDMIRISDPVELVHDEIYRSLYGELKRKRRGNEMSDIQKSFLERRANTMEGCNFRITTDRPVLVSWRLSVREAAMSGLIKSTCIKIETPVDTYKVPTKYDPLVIDIMVDFLTCGYYRLTNPPQLRRAQEASVLNKDLTAIVDMTNPVLIHFDVFFIAIHVDIPELASEAMKNLEYTFGRRGSSLPIEHYEMVVARLWKKTDGKINMNKHHQVHELRSMVGTYGAIMGPMWEIENLDTYLDMTKIHGKYPDYAIWHAQTVQGLGMRSQHELAPFIRKQLDEADKDSEGEANIKKEE